MILSLCIYQYRAKDVSVFQAPNGEKIKVGVKPSELYLIARFFDEIPENFLTALERSELKRLLKEVIDLYFDMADEY
jgi:hypothetical protein